MNQKRIIHVIPTLGIGGAERGLVTMLRALDRHKFSPEVIAIYKGGDLEQALREIGVPYRIIGMTGLYDMVALWRFDVNLQSPRVSLIHAHLLHGAIVGAVLAIFNKAKLVITIHNSYEWGVKKNFKTRIKLWFVRRLFYKADAVIGVSEEIMERLKMERVNFNKLHRISCPVDASVFVRSQEGEDLRAQFGISCDTKLIVSVGRLQRVKRFDVLLQSASMLKHNKLDFRLIIIGDGLLLEELTDLCKKLNIVDNVLFLGNRKDVPSLLSQADIFVVSSDTEGLSVALLEAMSMELPIIATNVGGNRELIREGQTGILVPVDAPEVLAKSIQYLLDHHQESINMGESARQFVIQHYDVNVVSVQTMNLYKTLLMEGQ